MLLIEILKETHRLSETALPLPELYRRVERHIPPFEWPILADDIAAILKTNSYWRWQQYSKSKWARRLSIALLAAI